MDPMKRLLLEVSYESIENGESHLHMLAYWAMTGVFW